MSQLRLARATDLEDFPGCLSVVNDTPPIAQCQETQIDEATGTIADGPSIITDVGVYVGFDLANKIVSVTAPVGEIGDYGVLSNTDDVLTTDHAFGEASAVVEYTIHDDGEVFLTRNESSFVRFVEDLGKAHTTVNGQLYTDVATGPLANACSDTYVPD